MYENRQVNDITTKIIKLLIFYYAILAYPIEMIFDYNILLYSDFLFLVILLFSIKLLKFKLESLIVLFGLIIITIISNLFASYFDLYQVMRQIRFIFIGYFLFLIIKNKYSISLFNQINKLMVSCGIISFLWLLRQYFWGWTSFEERWIIEYLNSQPDLSYIGTTRFFATFPYANTASLFFAIILLISLENIKNHYIFKIGLVVSLLGVILVQMRVGYIVSLFIFLFYIRKINKVYIVASIVAIIIVLISLEGEYFAYTIGKFSEPSFLLISIQQRLRQIFSSFAIYNKNIAALFWGAGLGRNNLINYIDNLYFNIIYQNGIIFMSILLGIFIKIYLKTVSNLKQYKKFYKLFVFIIIFYSFASNVLNNSIIFYIFILYLGLFNAMSYYKNIRIE